MGAFNRTILFDILSDLTLSPCFQFPYIESFANKLSKHLMRLITSGNISAAGCYLESFHLQFHASFQSWHFLEVPELFPLFLFSQLNVCYIFASLFYISKKEHLRNKKCFLFHLGNSFRSSDN